MKIGITGHTSGIGAQLSNHFLSKGDEVIGFSRTNGYDIDLYDDRKKIVEECADCDVFINNAYSNFNNSQLLMLCEIFTMWRGKSNIIINISSRYTTDPNHPYCTTKADQDAFCLSNIFNLPRIINIKPGLIDTPRVKNINNPKLELSSIIEIIEFSLHNNVQYIIYGKLS